MDRYWHWPHCSVLSSYALDKVFTWKLGNLLFFAKPIWGLDWFGWLWICLDGLGYVLDFGKNNFCSPVLAVAVLACRRFLFSGKACSCICWPHLCDFQLFRKNKKTRNLTRRCVHLFDMDPFGGKKVPCTKHQESGIDSRSPKQTKVNRGGDQNQGWP